MDPKSIRKVVIVIQKNIIEYQLNLVLNTYYIKIDYDIYKSPMMYFSNKNSTLDDVYAFGMIVYRLIAGEIPFPGDQKKS